MRTRQATLTVASFVVVGLVVPLLAQGPPVGTWKMNLAKSKYNTGAVAKSVTLQISAAGAGATTVVDSVAADGTTQHWTFTGNYDGKDLSIAGNNPNADTAARRRINATTTETTYKKGGKVTTVNTAVLSADGKTLTITAKGRDAQGSEVNNVQVYDKQ